MTEEEVTTLSDRARDRWKIILTLCPHSSSQSINKTVNISMESIKEQFQAA